VNLTKTKEHYPGPDISLQNQIYFWTDARKTISLL